MKIKSKKTVDGVTTIETESGHKIKMPEQNELPAITSVKTQIEILSDKIDALITAIGTLGKA